MCYQILNYLFLGAPKTIGDPPPFPPPTHRNVCTKFEEHRSNIMTTRAQIHNK